MELRKAGLIQSNCVIKKSDTTNHLVKKMVLESAKQFSLPLMAYNFVSQLDFAFLAFLLEEPACTSGVHR